MIKGIYEESSTNIVLSDERLEAFPRKNRHKTRMPTATTAPRHCTGGSSRAMRRIRKQSASEL